MISDEEKVWYLLNELYTQKAILENTLAQEDLSGYDKDLLEQYQEELDLYKRTTGFIEKLQYDKETLRDMVLEKQEEIKELKSNSIPKDKIKEKLNWYEDTCERLSKSGIELDMYDKYQGAIELCKELLEEE